MKIGFLGPEGTFSEEASKLYLKKLSGKVELVPYATFHDLLFAADRGRLGEAIVPLENSIEGTIGVVTDMLVKDVDLQIRQEIVIPVFHYLIAPKGARLKDITDVISIPQVLDQCQDYLRKKMPKARLHFASSTASAVNQVAGSFQKGFAAIGTKSAAKLYGMNILAEKINARDNKTRFIVLAQKDHPPTRSDKTSIVFAGKKDRPGSLHDILSVFAVRNINLTKIESRPSKKALGEYYFFADMEGHRKDRVMAEALEEIKKKASFLKVLGSYPKAGR